MIRFFITPAFLWSLTIFAQPAEIGNWIIYFGDKKINSKWNWHHELQYRSFNIAGDTDQLLLRTGIGYNLSENNNNVLAGYGFIYNEPYAGTTDDKTDFTEHRIYQQFITRQSFGPIFIQHRYRFEQRFFEDDFKSRFRYFLGFNVPVNRKEMVKEAFYISAYNEIFVNTKPNMFDRNRAYGGIGYKFSNSARAELGFLNQLTEIGSRNQFNFITYVNL